MNSSAYNFSFSLATWHEENHIFGWFMNYAFIVSEFQLDQIVKFLSLNKGCVFKSHLQKKEKSDQYFDLIIKSSHHKTI